jgi:AcrR family transcriptional regulator
MHEWPDGAKATRRTQAERRASTRAALVRATIDSLVEVGYAGTTTNEIQQRAGVSRGALTHHFASKAELLLAAMDHLYEDSSAKIRDAAPGLPSGPERIRPAIWLLWEQFNGPLFLAAMELWVAARTDTELRAALLPHERRLGRQLRQLAVEVFGGSVAAHSAAETVYQVLMTSMRGQAMTYALQPDAPLDGPHVQYWFDLVEAFAEHQPS